MLNKMTKSQVGKIRILFESSLLEVKISPKIYVSVLLPTGCKGHFI